MKISDENLYFEALKTRDPRFDGKFFVAVKTTGIYCRPICPARPKRENVRFFSSSIEAERAGYRPCLRCRPESAPRSAAWVGKSAVVRRALKMIHSQDLIALNEDEFAKLFGVTARHLRRLFISEIGKTPKQLSFENRLNLAQKLIVETPLPISEVVFASGFQSVRRFNDAFKDRFRKRPQDMRRKKDKNEEGLRLTLPYRPPFHFQALLRHYESHGVGLLESFENEKYHRIISYDKNVGEILVSNDSTQSRLNVEIHFSDTSKIHDILSRVRSMFDLDSDPVVVANVLEKDPRLKWLLKKHRGIRLPSGWDPFETAISILLGQVVSVARGRTLVADLIELLGESSKVGGIKLFPNAEKISLSSLASLKTTELRKKTLKAFSQAIVDGSLSLEPTQDVSLFIEKIMAIRGIGPWTAQYIALKCLRHTDALPETDLILARYLDGFSPKSTNAMSPWRGYIAALLWHEDSQLKKEGIKK